MVSGVRTFTKTNIIRRAAYEDVCNWVIENWEEITPDLLYARNYGTLDSLKCFLFSLFIIILYS